MIKRLIGVLMEKRGQIAFLIILMFILIVFILLFTIPSGDGSNNQSHEKIGVIVTVAPQAEFVKKVGGERVEVTVMVPLGADPHTYEPLPKQMKDISEADMYAMVGSGIEFELLWMEKIQGVNPQMKVINSSQGIPLMESTGENEEGTDPHVWVSPKNAKIMTENIYRELVMLDPDNENYYTKNKDKYLLQLDELDKNISSKLSNRNGTKIMVYHPAWAYFCRDYNIQQISIESLGKEPTPQKIASLVDQARKEDIKVIFVTPQFSARNAEVIANEIGGRVIVIDNLSENYIETMQKVAEAFQAS